MPAEIEDMFIENREFKSLAKENKSIRPALRKAVVGVPTMVGDRQAKFVLSTSQVDRDYDVIHQDGIDLTSFVTNPVVFFGHEHDSLPIGKMVSVGIEDGCLVGVIEFAPADNPAVGAKAEGIYKLVRDGYLNTVSIGFIATEWKFADDDERFARDGADVTRCELVEVSVVGIPSNRSALVLDVGVERDRVDPAFTPAPLLPSEPAKRYRAPRMHRILASMARA